MEFSEPRHYGGANRRCDTEAMEIRLSASREDLFKLAQGFPHLIEQLSATEPALATAREDIAITSLPALCARAARLAVLLQNIAGHAVKQHGSASDVAGERHYAWFEIEEAHTGEQVCALLIAILQLAVKDDPQQDLQALSAQVQSYVTDAVARAMPADVWAIVRAADRQYIPVMRMDRPPFEPIEGSFRIRRHGLLRLGHGHRAQTVDGTFCVDRNQPLHALTGSRKLALDHCHTQVSSHCVIASDWCYGAAQAARRAERMTYPVQLLCSARTVTSTVLLVNKQQVLDAAQACLRQGAEALLVVPGDRADYRIVLCAGSQYCISLRPDPAKTGKTHDTGYLSANDCEALQTSVRDIAAQLDIGLLAVVALRDASVQAGWTLVDVDPAPTLHHFLPPGPQLDRLAEHFVDWIFPDPAASRIPIVAITGTNGKSTTSSMLEHILNTAGVCTGLASSFGSRVRGQRISRIEEAYMLGHIRVLDNPTVETAVLESTRAAAAGAGLGFTRCALSICLNVTDDHLTDELDTPTLEDLAEAKLSIVRRATQAVVLNADDPFCTAMLPSLKERTIGLVTLTDPGLSTIDADATAGLSRYEDQDWITIKEGPVTTRVVSVNNIPMAFEGRARHNVSNALHAALAAHLLDVDTADIARGLESLLPEFEQLPGRLTEITGLPFTLFLDYGHNPAGVGAASHFASATETAGRRILCFACNAQNSDQTILDTSAAAAGHFDLYVCKNFGNLYHRSAEDVPRLLRQGLLDKGVLPHQIFCETEELTAIESALNLAQPGDLVIVIGGRRHDLVAAHIAAWVKNYPQGN